MCDNLKVPVIPGRTRTGSSRCTTTLLASSTLTRTFILVNGSNNLYILTIRSQLINTSFLASAFSVISPDEFEASSRIVRKQLAEKRERLMELERKRFAGMRLEPLSHQFAYFDCSIEDGNPLNCLPAGRSAMP